MSENVCLNWMNASFAQVFPVVSLFLFCIDWIYHAYDMEITYRGKHPLKFKRYYLGTIKVAAPLFEPEIRLRAK